MTSTHAITSTRETERKYEVGEDARLPELTTLLAPDHVAPAADDGPNGQELDAVYFDTADLALARAGVTLRRREGGTDAGWHLKFPAGTDSREELRLPLGRARRNPPAALLALTRVHVRGAKVAPVLRLVTQRRRWVLADDEGLPLAEVAEDRVTAHTMGGDTEASHWRELEVELTEHGSTALLDRVQERLATVGVRRSASGNKLSRVLGERLADATQDAAAVAEGSAGAAVLDYVRTQAERLRGYDPLVRRGAPDAVHQMRVASRRIRSALQAYRAVLDRDATASLIEELTWLGTELAPARDTEVMAQRCAEQIAALPDDLVLGPVAATMDRTFARRQVDGRTRALTALDGDRYLALHDAVDTLLADPPLTVRARRSAKRELSKGVGRAYRRLARRMAVVDGAGPGTDRDLALHEARKAAKRLRYAVETAEPALGKPAKRLRKRLKKVQSLLGDHQDTVVLRPVLREFGAQVHAEGGNGFTFGVLHGEEAARAEQAERELPATWAALRSSKAVRTLVG